MFIMSSVGGTVMSLFGCSENLGDFWQICMRISEQKSWVNIGTPLKNIQDIEKSRSVEYINK